MEEKVGVEPNHPTEKNLILYKIVQYSLLLTIKIDGQKAKSLTRQDFLVSLYFSLLLIMVGIYGAIKYTGHSTCSS
jgi:hypothetical protein